MKRSQAKGAGARRASGSAKRSAKASSIRVTRNSPRPQIKASRGSGGPTRQRTLAQSRRHAGAKTLTESDRRVAETRRQSLSSLGNSQPAPSKRGHGGSSDVRTGGGSGGVRTVAVASSGAAASAARVVQEVARPVGAITKPVLRVVGGGLEAIPQAAGRARPETRGRLLIVLVGLLGAGLIYINVGRLEAGDGFARYQQRSIELQRENTALRSRITNLGAAERIKRYAQMQGLVMPAPQQFTYLKSRRGDALKAAGVYAPPVSAARPLAPGASAQTGATPQVATPAPGDGL